MFGSSVLSKNRIRSKQFRPKSARQNEAVLGIFIMELLNREWVSVSS